MADGGAMTEAPLAEQIACVERLIVYWIDNGQWGRPPATGVFSYTQLEAVLATLKSIKTDRCSICGKTVVDCDFVRCPGGSEE